MIVGLTAACEGGLLILALLLGWLVGTPALGKLAPSWPMFCRGALVSLMLLVAAAVAFRLPWAPLARLRELLEQVVGSLFAQCTLFDLALISILAGLGEEAFFRGFLQTALAEVLDPRIAVTVVGVVFGLAHCVSLGYAVTAALIGVLFGWLLLFFDNLLVPMTAHAVYDFVVLTYLIHIRGVRLLPAPEEPP